MIAGVFPFCVSLARGASRDQGRAAGPIWAAARERQRPASPGYGSPSCSPGRWLAVYCTGSTGIATRRRLARSARLSPLATCLSLAIEVMQIVIPGRDVDLTSVVLAAFGSALGATLVVRSAGRGCSSLDRAGALILIWGVAIIAGSLEPTEIRLARPRSCDRKDRPFLVVFR